MGKNHNTTPSKTQKRKLSKFLLGKLGYESLTIYIPKLRQAPGGFAKLATLIASRNDLGPVFYLDAGDSRPPLSEDLRF